MSNLHPIDQFKLWYQEACVNEIMYPDAMTLATISEEGRPRARVVLMKDFSTEGITFYTNTLSQKGRDLAVNPYVALNFYWKTTRKQIRIEGKVSAVDSKVADAYFQTRLLGSQISAWASKQSEKLESPSEFEERVSQYALEFKDGPVPRPPHWSGYLVTPDLFEFWEEKPFRMHDRTVYKRSHDTWETFKLYP